MENINSEIREKMEDCSRKGWIKVWFAIEVMARDPEVAETSLRNHVAKMENIKDLFIFDKKFLGVEKVENPLRNIKEAYCQVVEVSLYVKDFYTLINIVVTFGPSAIEIMEPKEYKLKIDEMQNMTNVISGIMHQFASAGIGGMVITPQGKQ